MLQPTPLADLPPFSDTAAASIRRQLAARRLCDLGLGATGRLEAGRLRPVAAPFLPLEFLPGWLPPRLAYVSAARVPAPSRKWLRSEAASPSPWRDSEGASPPARTTSRARGHRVLDTCTLAARTHDV